MFLVDWIKKLFFGLIGASMHKEDDLIADEEQHLEGAQNHKKKEKKFLKNTKKIAEKIFSGTKKTGRILKILYSHSSPRIKAIVSNVWKRNKAISENQKKIAEGQVNPTMEAAIAKQNEILTKANEKDLITIQEIAKEEKNSSAAKLANEAKSVTEDIEHQEEREVTQIKAALTESKKATDDIKEVIQDINEERKAA